MTWEEQFQDWAKPPGVTEQTKCENAERACRKAVAESTVLAGHGVSVIQQGSYRNRTNGGIDTDVDLCVLCADSILFDLPENTTPAQFGIIVPWTYSYLEYKRDVGGALASYLGAEHVTRGDKAFDVHENTYRIDADVVACFEYRYYMASGQYLVGTSFLTDGGKRIVNWPEQNYTNGVAKNTAAGRRFKGCVRILKHLRDEMNREGIAAAKPIASYLCECLVWNVPNEGFGHDSMTADVRWVLAHIFNNTRQDENCREWCEVNQIKYLFHGTQPWTREQAHGFVSAAWDYIGLR
jgi:hypothetical protein